MKIARHLFFLFAVTTWASIAAAVEIPEPPVLDPESVAVTEELETLYGAFFPAGIFTATDGVYVARGYNRDNPVLIEGKSGLIVVDPGESIPAAQVVKAAFQVNLDNIFDRKKVKAIIYTHHHDCHIHGSSVYADKNTKIIAHENLMPILYTDWFSQIYPARLVGGTKMSGGLFAQNEGWFYGGGLFARQIHGDSGFLPPTKTVRDTLKTEIAGVKVHLFSAPGETRDVLVVWLPEKQTMIQIANLYEAFPAITTLRGAYPRDPLSYIQSIDLYRSLNPEHLVLIHGPHPVISGKNEINQIFTNVRDALQFVHDQTVQGMNKGLTPGEIVDRITLPSHLAAEPFLQEVYGDIERNVYEIFWWYRGSFSGKCRDLFPQSPVEKAEMAASLAGGVSALADKAGDALEEGKPSWALELADDALLLDSGNASARDAKNKALLELAETTINAQKRNYLLSEYLMENDQGGDLGDKLIAIQQDPKTAFASMGDAAVANMPLDALFRIMAVTLQADKCLTKELTAGLQLVDMPKKSAYYDLTIRRGILETKPQNPTLGQFVIVCDLADWKQLVLGKLDPQAAVASGAVAIAGADPEKFYEFMGYFEE